MTDSLPSGEPATQRLFVAWTHGVSRHAGLVILLIGLASIFGAWFTAENLAINTSTTDMISADTPFRRNAIEYDHAFPHFSNLIIVVIDASSKDAASEMANGLVAALRDKEELFSRVDYPAGDPFFRQNGLLYLNIDELTALADRLAAAEPFLATLARQPDLAGLFGFFHLILTEGGDAAASGEIQALFGRVAGVTEALADKRQASMAWRDLLDTNGGAPAREIVIARPNLDAAGISPGADALAAIRQLSANIQSDIAEDVSVRLTGSVAIDDEELRSVIVGGEKAGMVTLGLVILLLVIGLRSPRLILPTVATLIAGLIWTAAFAALAIGHLNLISVAFAVLFIGLGVDFSIHYCLYYREHADRDTAAALRATSAGLGGSLAISALCAAAGFLSFMPTDYKGLAELGLISGGGMAIAFFLNMTLLPALLAFFPDSAQRLKTTKGSRAPFTRRHHRPILLVAATCGIAGLAAAPFADFDFNPMNLKDPDAESVAAFRDLASNPRNGVYAVDILVSDLEQAKSESTRLQKLPEVGQAVTLHSLVPVDQDEKLSVIEDMAFFLAPALTVGTVPEPDTEIYMTAVQNFQEKAAEFLTANPDSPLSAALTRLDRALSSVDLTDSTALMGLNRRLTVHLPAMLGDLRHALEAKPVDIDDIPKQIRDNWVARDGRVRVQLWPAAAMTSNTDLKHFAAALLAASPSAVGTPVTISEAGTAVVTAFREASLIAFVLVAVILVILLRDITGLALVMLPLVLAAVLTGGTSVALNLPFNFANIIVLPLLFGLGVASGVHMVLRDRRNDRASDVMQTSTPRAVLFSALTTIASFGSLALSGHLGMTSMGQLLTIAIGYTLICMLLVLPAMMAWLDQRRS